MRKTGNFAVLVLFTVLQAQLTFGQATQAARAWQPTLDTARQVAAQHNRPILLYFYTDWCTACKRMEQEVFAQAGVVEGLQQHIVLVKVNADHFPATRQQYAITAVPTTIIATADGRHIDRLQGACDLRQFTGWLYKAMSNFRPAASSASPQASDGRPNYPSYPTANLASVSPRAAPPGEHRPVAAPWAALGGAHVPTAPSPPVNPPAASASATNAIVAPSVGTHAPSVPSPNVNVHAGPSGAYVNPADRYADYYARRYQTATTPAIPVGREYSEANRESRSGATDSGGHAALPPPYVPPAYVPPNAAPSSASVPSAASVPSTAGVSPAFGAPSAVGVPSVADSPVVAAPGLPGVAAPAAGEPVSGTPTAHPPLGLDGYCPVTLVDEKNWAIGDRRWGAIHRGRTYLFKGPEEQRRFLADPDTYAPMASGCDVVAAVEQGRQVPGRREHGVFFGRRVFLFADEASLEKFSRNPNHYANQVLQAMRSGATNGPTWR